MKEVGFWDFILGLGEGFGEGGVVGEDDETGSGAVEASGEVEFGCPRFVDEVDDGFVGGIGGGREDAGGFVEKDDAAGFCLEDFSGSGEVVEFPEGKGGFGDELAVEKNVAIFEKTFCMAFSEAGVFGDELGDGHGWEFKERKFVCLRLRGMSGRVGGDLRHRGCRRGRREILLLGGWWSR